MIILKKESGNMANSPDTVYVLVTEGPDFTDIKEVVFSLKAARKWESKNVTDEPNTFGGIYGYYPVKIIYRD